MAFPAITPDRSPRNADRSLAATLLAALVASACLVREADAAVPPPKIDFNRHVRPILAEYCLKCHGSDEKQRKGKLRLDLRDAALDKKAIVPGMPNESKMVERILTLDEEDVMPPAKEHRALSVEQKEIIQRWIAEGAEYKKHWAFIAPEKPPVPELPSASARNLNPIDAFVLDRLAAAHVEPAPETTRERWLRRVTFDLTGLPPTLAEMDAFLADQSESAFEAVADRLLASRAFGERMAYDWLDAARYADTYGRHEDADSAVWPYRDWVVKAFNANMPYDQFLVWQTAGDLLPNPTQEQIIATAFNRLVNQSNEAGSNEEEFRQEHVVDRVKTNATAILGLTLECARCHDHKYDPFTMRDFYSFSAFLNNIDELGLFARQTAGVPAPSLLLFTPEQEASHRNLLNDAAAVESVLAALRESKRGAFEKWCREHGEPSLPTPVAHFDFEEIRGKKAAEKKAFHNRIHPDAPPATSRQTPTAVEGKAGKAIHFENDNSVEIPGVGDFRRGDPFTLAFWFETNLEQERAVLLHHTRGGLDAANRGYEIILNHGRVEFSLSHFAPGNSIRIRSRQKLPLGKWTHIVAVNDGSSRAAGLHLYLDGKPAEVDVISDNLYRDIRYRQEWGDFDSVKIQDNGTPAVHLALAWRYNDMGVKDGAFDELMVFDKALTAREAAELADGWPKEKPRPGMMSRIADWFGFGPSKTIDPAWLDAWLRDHDEKWTQAEAKLHALRTEADDLVNHVDDIMVMREMRPRRPTFVLNRGQFDQRGAEVSPDTPAALPRPPADTPRDRLGLARWYVDRGNPLTARVAVNRIWQIFFGRGIVGTTEDFGVQGELPSHPELLDWLACDFMEHGWDVKRLCRMITLTATYRQSSMPRDKSLLENDPQNRLLARGPRHRLSAELIRDTALAVSGELVHTPGGAPAKPYQPENLYEDSGVQDHYDQDHGDKLFRRSLYTYWKRTMPPPNMLVFDAPTREFCRVRRERTNTPLQALVLLNDPQFIEACRVMAEHEVRSHPEDLDNRIVESFRLWVSRKPTSEELEIMRRLVVEERAHFAAHPDEAGAFRRRIGEAAVDEALSAVEVAAIAAMERVLLGDDETIFEQ